MSMPDTVHRDMKRDYDIISLLIHAVCIRWYILLQDNDRAIARARKDFLIRHHLDRTTGVGM